MHRMPPLLISSSRPPGRPSVPIVASRWGETTKGGSTNLRTQLLRIVRRAGVEPWERLFHNLRASRETELAKEYPIHVVTAWLGNTPSIAMNHYLQVTVDDYTKALQNPMQSSAKALQNPVQQPAASPREVQQKTPQSVVGYGVTQNTATGCDPVQSCTVPPRGVEPLSSD